MLLDDLCKARLVDLLMPLARFCGLEVITYCMMGNHFHLLLRVPVPVALSDEELFRRAEGFYGSQGGWWVWRGMRWGRAGGRCRATFARRF